MEIGATMLATRWLHRSVLLLCTEEGEARVNVEAKEAGKGGNSDDGSDSSGTPTSAPRSAVWPQPCAVPLRK
jgi:hypothetical protein